MEAAGIEPFSALFEKQRRRATFVVKSRQGNELMSNSLPCSFPWSPLESSPVVEKWWKAAGQVSRRRRTIAHPADLDHGQAGSGFITSLDSLPG